MMRKNKLVTPILKWAGGKKQLFSQIEALIPKKYTSYYEPFLGGGAVLFSLQPKTAYINDYNEELINVYDCVKNNLEELISLLQTHENTSEYFYKIRELDRDSKSFSKLSNVEKASRFIYLNKTCYNGLFRVNRAGEFNTPFGHYKTPNIVNEPALRAVSLYLNENNIIYTSQDFEKFLANVEKGAFVYLDPPYDPVSLSSNFTGYTSLGFDRGEQIRLKNVCDELNQKGIKFLLSNSATDFIQKLYSDYSINIIKAKRSINSNATLRGNIDEVLIRNYE